VKRNSAIFRRADQQSREPLLLCVPQGRKTPETVHNELRRLRRKRGLSAADLANTVGVSRQTIYAIEAGKYLPNTAVALKLARTLSVSLEDIFSLPKRLRRTKLHGVAGKFGEFREALTKQSCLPAICKTCKYRKLVLSSA
jgi:DNA-binding XRE family transcriptional regulator